MSTVEISLFSQETLYYFALLLGHDDPNPVEKRETCVKSERCEINFTPSPLIKREFLGWQGLGGLEKSCES